MWLRLLAIAFFGVLSPNSKLAAQSCPAEQPDTRVLVHRLLTRAAHESSRVETGLTGVDTASVRLLVDETDAAACQRLNAFYGSAAGSTERWHWSYFTAGGRLFIAVQYIDPPGIRRVGFVPLYVLDADAQLLHAYAM